MTRALAALPWDSSKLLGPDESSGAAAVLVAGAGLPSQATAPLSGSFQVGHSGTWSEPIQAPVRVSVLTYEITQ